jgi:hypothetical protein
MYTNIEPQDCLVRLNKVLIEHLCPKEHGFIMNRVGTWVSPRGWLAHEISGPPWMNHRAILEKIVIMYFDIAQAALRMGRAKQEPLEVLGNGPVEWKPHFKTYEVKGSTGNCYFVKIAIKLSCTCKDWRVTKEGNT